MAQYKTGPIRFTENEMATIMCALKEREQRLSSAMTDGQNVAGVLSQELAATRTAYGKIANHV